MNSLLDTHTLIWFLDGDPQLSLTVRQIIEDDSHTLWISVASLWEMAIKFSTGKLNLGQPFEKLFPQQLEDNDIAILGITVEHLKIVGGLPYYHRDPFDRLIIAQAQVETMPLLSIDAVFDAYGVRRIW